MNSMIGKLIFKDWYFNQKQIVSLSLLGFLSLFLLTIKSSGAFYTGLVLLISTIVCIGALLIFSTIINERKNQNLAFIMSLPISYMDYTKAKFLMNFLAFFIVWLLLLIGTLAVIYFTNHIPNGLMPLSVIILTELLMGFVILLATAMISESETWTITIMSFTNVGVSLFMFWVSSFAEISHYSEGATPIWNSTALIMITSEVLIIGLVIMLTFYFQAKKTDFL